MLAIIAIIAIAFVAVAFTDARTVRTTRERLDAGLAPVPARERPHDTLNPYNTYV